jgi:hypothetical protein
LTDDDKKMTDAAFIKWRSGEALTRADAKRLIYVFQNCELKFENLDQAAFATLQLELRNALSKFFPQQ